MSKVFFGSSGSDANDTQVKLVWFYNNALGRPQKKKIIARQRGYHGVTIASASLTGLASMHTQFDLPLPMIKHTTAPHRLWEAEPGMSDEAFTRKLATDLETMILAEGPDTVAAFIAEPVLAAGGVVVPPAGYFPAIQEVLRRYDVLLIADEVVTGFGRLGQPFGTQVLGLEPDLITVAKGMTSAYVPLSGVLVSEKVWRVLVDGTGAGAFGHGYTYTSHPIAAAAALANLDLIESEGLVAQAGSRGAYLQQRLRRAVGDHPLVGEVRGLGLMAAVEFVAVEGSAARVRPEPQGRCARHARLPRARRHHACAAGRRHDLVRAAVRDHRAGDRYDRGRRPRGHGPGRRRAPARDLTDAPSQSTTPRRRLGLIVNPLAGLGGRVGLKGTDGADVQRRALELGATAGSPSRADRALARLAPARSVLHVVAGAGSLGADLAAARGFEPEVVGEPRAATTSRDTRRAARAMERDGVDLLLFAGGDGTARDLLEAVADRVPVLGIPSGVKMRSGVFAASPEAAADAALQLPRAAGQRSALRDGEVADLEDAELEGDDAAGLLYGTLRVPAAKGRVLSAKSSSLARSPAALDAVCGDLAAEIARGGLFILGPGTTTRRVLELLGIDGSLLGVDVVSDGELLVRDASEDDLLAVTRDRPATIVVGIVGGQGSLFGRGNQQISAEVIRRAGPESIVIVAGLDKLQALDPSCLHVDTGDPDVDRMLEGYRRVRYAPSMSALLHVAR